MGISIASQCFTRAMNQVFSDILYRELVLYVDDLCSFAPNFEVALERLETVFKRLEESGLKIKTSKCHFFYEEIKLLGFNTGIGGIKPLEERVEALLKLPTPKSVKDVRSLLGAFSYYRTFVKGYSALAYPLTELTKQDKTKKCKFLWTAEHEEALNTLKKAMTTPPVLAFFSEEKDTVLRTDASRRGISGELLQVQEDGTLRPIAYVSRKISNTEGKWSVSELELLAIVYSVNHFRSMLYGKYFEVQSDHSSLQYYKNIKCLTSRLNRLALKFLDYNFKIVHKTGASIRMADLLSRYPLDKELDEEAAAEEFEINVIRCVNIRKLQLEDPFLGRIRQALLDPESAERRTLRASRLYTLVDDFLHFEVYTCGQAKNILALPEALIDDVLKAYHESLASGAHMGIAKTYNRIREKYFLEKYDSGHQKVHTFVSKVPGKQTGQTRPYRIVGAHSSINSTI